ncbi:MAG: glycosyltransferase family 39 protein [Gemmatimonadetes bacterium]|nr:glycosyltransferase family 39 protein [Gemmatimonadota bacterium]
MSATLVAPAAGSAAERVAPRGRPWTAALEAGVVAALTVVAFLLRCVPALRSGMYNDEAQLLGILRLGGWPEILRFLRLHESHPPLFYALVAVWQAVFGAGDAAAIMLPVLLGAALVPLGYAVARDIGSAKGAVAAAALAAVCPALVEHSTYLRPYSLLPLLGLASSYFLWRALARGGRGVWAGYVATTAALLWTHAASVILLLGQGAVAMLRLVPRREWRLLAGWALTQAAVALLFLPWLPALLHQARAVGYPPFGLSLPYRLIYGARMAAMAVFSTEKGFLASAGLAAPVAAALGLGWVAAHLAVLGLPTGTPDAAARSDDRRWTRLVLLGAPLGALLAAAVLSGRANLLHERCFVLLTPLLMVALGLKLGELADRSRAAAALLGALVLGAYAAIAAATPPRSNSRELAAVLNAEVRPGDLLVEVPGNFATGLHRYLRPGNARIDFPAPGPEPVTRYDGFWDRLRDPAALERTRRAAAPARAGRPRGGGAPAAPPRRARAPRGRARAGAPPRPAGVADREPRIPAEPLARPDRPGDQPRPGPIRRGVPGRAGAGAAVRCAGCCARSGEKPRAGNVVGIALRPALIVNVPASNGSIVRAERL